MKTVQRVFSVHFFTETIESGFYVGAKDEIGFLPLPFNERT
jgi:hypothetical protein